MKHLRWKAYVDGLFRSRLELVLVLVLGLLAFSPNIGAPPLIDWDEATYAEVAHEAVANGRYLDFTWNGTPYLKKPPLLFWMMAGSFKAFGENEFAARLPSLLMGLGTLALLYFGAAAVGGRAAGTFAAIIPLGFYFFIARGGRECATDGPLLFFTTLALYALTRGRHHRRWLAVVAISCGLAILSKGAAGLIPLVIAIAAMLLLSGFAAIGWSGIFVVVTGTIIVAAPWYTYQALSNPPMFFSSLIGHETVQRAFSHLEDNTRSANFTLVTLYSEVRYLWPILLPLAAIALRAFGSGLRRTLLSLDPAVHLWMLWLAIAFGAACAVQTKLPWYVLPALIPVALMAGTVLGAAFRQSEPFGRYAAALAIIALAFIAAGVPARWAMEIETADGQRERSVPAYTLAMRAREAALLRGGGELFFAGAELPTLVYYSGMRCHFVETSELKHIELVGAEPVPRHLRFLDLVLLDSRGAATSIGNLDTEWVRVFGPGDAPQDEITNVDDLEDADVVD
ncbi:MAG: glycosyltransferase family 39 protein [Candidatus Binataceae bacterium]